MTIDRKRIILQAFQDVIHRIEVNQEDLLEQGDTVDIETLMVHHIVDNRYGKLYRYNMEKRSDEEIDELSNWLNIKENDNR